jgi:hypothetical protein
MSTTTTSIFTFDHGQKKLNKAIGVEESYLDDLQQKIGDTLRQYIFNEDKSLRDEASPSELVEACLHNYSYNQLVLMASFFMQNKLEDFTKKLESGLGDMMKKTVKRIALDTDDIPPHIREFLEGLTKDGKGVDREGAVDGDSLPPHIKEFLDGLVRGEMEKEEGEDGDDE